MPSCLRIRKVFKIKFVSFAMVEKRASVKMVLIIMIHSMIRILKDIQYSANVKKTTYVFIVQSVQTKMKKLEYVCLVLYLEKILCV